MPDTHERTPDAPLALAARPGDAAAGPFLVMRSPRPLAGPTRSRSRRRARIAAHGVLATLAACLLPGCYDEPIRVVTRQATEGQGPPVAAPLAAQSAEFERRVVEVTDGVHVAIGYGLANSILLEGDDGSVIVDAMGTTESAQAVRAAFDEITDAPLRAIVYTHNHADHVFGGPGLLAPGEAGQVEVIAHETTEYYIDRVVGILRPILARRSARMFGTPLPFGDEGLVNCGIGPALEIGRGGHLGLLRPTRTFADELSLTIAGIDLRLVHAPGETPDQIFVWLPDKRVLLPGDNVYKAFPNLYTIRGTLYRDVLAWSESLDAMRALRPAHLVPSHTSPVSGEAEIEDILLAYRDAIQFVHDQTIRGMNRGLNPDELVKEVVLPPHLATHPYLQELYGTVAWSVRAIFSGALGWFNGDAATLSPPDPVERARSTIALAGGINQVIEAADDALAEGRAAWAAELVQHVLVIAPGHGDARAVKAAALRQLGRESVSANGRNYYLSQALELEGEVARTDDPPALVVDDTEIDVLRGIPIDNFMRAMPVNLDARRAADVDTVAVFEFIDPAHPDVPTSTWTLHVRRGVAALQPGSAPDPDLRVRTAPKVWKELVVGRRNPAAAYAGGDLQVEGGPIALARFLGLFR